MTTYKDYPNLHHFLAGDAAENSVPYGAYAGIANELVKGDAQLVFVRAEVYLASLKKTPGELFKAGYETACGMCVDDPDTCIGDCEDVDAEWTKLYAKYGLDYEQLAPVIDLIY